MITKPFALSLSKPVMSLSNGVNVVRQGSPEFSEGLTTNGIILLYYCTLAL
ncbi:MAG: hypothetical protein QX190_06245 [Methylococcales bacterium]